MDGWMDRCTLLYTDLRRLILDIFKSVIPLIEINEMEIGSV